MKKLHKILLFFVSLIGFLFSVGILSAFYYVPVITDALMGYRALYPFLEVALSGFAAFLCLCFLLLLLSALISPVRPNDLILVKGRGKLLFSRQTVESTVRYSFGDVEGINSSRVRVKLGRKPEKTRIYVKLSVSDPGRLAGLSETVQEQIESVLKSSLGVTAKSIEIKAVDFSADKSAPADARVTTAQNIRVE